MNYIVITDLFGNKISKNATNNNNLPFILLKTSQPHLLMERIGSANNKKSSVYRLIYPTIMHVLYINGINPSNFAPLGNIWYPKSNLPTSEELLLVNTNTNLSQYPTDYVKLGEYDNLYVWKPIAPRGYRAIGYLLSRKKPSPTLIRTVNKKFVTEFRDKMRSNTLSTLTNMNEFKLMALIGDKKYTIDRTKLLDKDYLVLIMSKDGIVTHQNKNNSVAKVKKDRDKFQHVNYSIQGELKMDGKCLGVLGKDSVHDDYVYIQECNSDDTQKWYPFSGHFVSQYDGSCLKSVNDDLTVTNCKDEDSQIWKTVNLRSVVNDMDQESIESWKTRYGKRVVLLEPDHPWYIRKNTNKEPEGLIIQNMKELNKNEYEDQANFKSTFMLDTTTPSMGYGYSIEQRKGRPCSCVEDCHNLHEQEDILENFDGDKSKKSGFNFNLIACTLLSLVVILVLIRMILNWRKSKKVNV